MLQKIKKLYKSTALLFFSNHSRVMKRKWNFNLFAGKVKDCFRTNIVYKPYFIELGESKYKHKWVGAQFYNESLITIPNDEIRVLTFNDEVSFINGVKDGLFKWTGGCVWDNAVFCFPRTSNSFLRIENKVVKEVPLSISYNCEHHYSGVCIENGIVYQPPRNTNHILRTDLKTGISTKLDIIDVKYRIKLRYCGSIVHPNGFIYFFPENGRVIKLDPVSDKWCFIGKQISTMCFDAKVSTDGNIYGYSSYQNGIMKIDVFKETVKMIHKDIYPGAYGTKYGLDGCLYSVPGDGSKIWRYNVDLDRVEEVFDLCDDAKAKYAGGVTLPDGRIICVPATANKILILVPNLKAEIPDKYYKEYFVDNY